jgi:hypothetical protein
MAFRRLPAIPRRIPRSSLRGYYHAPSYRALARQAQRVLKAAVAQHQHR